MALVCIVAVVLFAAALPVDAQLALDEKGLWEIWQKQKASPDDHAGLVAACAEFTREHSHDPLNGVADTVAAWHLLKLGKRAEAAALLERYVRIARSPLSRGVGIVASSWLTRMDRERVKAALQFYYRKQIGYPRTLQDLAAYEKLPKALTPPYKDRWGQAWTYRLVGLKTLPGLLNQKYDLQSRTLEGGSDLPKALTLGFGEGIEAKPAGMRSTTPGHEVVDMLFGPRARETDAGANGRASVVSVGTWTEGVFLAYVGKRIILVCDRYHWDILVKPTGP